MGSVTPPPSFSTLDVRALSGVPTPALLVDEAAVVSNIMHVTRLIDGAERWRVHCKTARSPWAVETLLAHGVRKFKASTLDEVETVLRAGGTDVLYAVPTFGPAQRALAHLAEEFRAARLSCLVDSVALVESWEPGRLGVFLDVNTGMDRTGLAVDQHAEARTVLRIAQRRGFRCYGVHHYDGHLAALLDAERIAGVHRGLDRLTEFVTALDTDVGEIVTGGTHTFLASLDHDFPAPLAELVTVGPGTVVYCDLRSLERLRDPALRPAVGVLARVVSTPIERQLTVDAGLTAIQVDAGTPHAAVVGNPNADVGQPAQAHLRIHWPTDDDRPMVGDLVVLIPRHVDTTVAQFQSFLGVQGDGTVRRRPMGHDQR